ncbi:unnamed protein product [Adineta ricciae]|uniref:Uncharacterized protein n=2 Tax=Adineta ricciae TaxID=249248 RepID=A0A815MKC5_ADIRI|nr:unnamed protein product [Adineta ricciae]
MDQIEMLTTDRHITSVERAVAGIPMHNNSELFSNTQSTFDFYDETQEKDEISISNPSHELKRSILGTPSGILRDRNGTFATQVTYGVGSAPAWIVIVDLNNDTRLDLIVGCSGVSNVYILFGLDNGLFEAAISYPAHAKPFSVAVGDLNNDKRLDLILTDTSSTKASILLQSNTGALVTDLTYAPGGGSKLQSIAIRSLNNDSRLDMVVANYGTDDISILFSTDNETLLNRLTIGMESNSQPTSVAIGHFNDDSQLDIAVALSGFRQVGILLGDGRGSFIRQATHQVPSESRPFVISSGDFNNDGRTEIVVGYGDSDEIDVLTVLNSGSFADPQTYLVGFSPGFIVLADMNNDSYADMMVVNYDSDSVSVFLGVRNGSFQYESTYSVESSPTSAAVGDFNNDDRLDLVVTNGDTENLALFLGFGNGSFGIVITIKIDYTAASMAVGDFNNDRNLDILLGSPNRVIMLRGYGNGSFASETVYSNYSSPRYIFVADFNNDTYLDFAVANYDFDNVGIFLNYGNGSFTPQTTFSVDSKPITLAVGDLDDDGRLDIVAGTIGHRTVTIRLGNGDGSFQKKIIYSVGILPESVVIGDFNNDGHLDIIAANVGSNYLSVLLGYGDGRFAPQNKYQTGSGARFIASKDLNSDAKLDVVVANIGDNTVTVWFGCSNLIFGKQTTLSIDYSSKSPSFTIHDFNHDNYTDIIVANSYNNNISVFLGYGNFSFTNRTVYSTGAASSPYSIASGDFNHDNHLDLAVADFLSNTIEIFSGDGNGSFSPNQTTYSTGSSSSPSSLAVDYFNNDTNLDIIVINYNNNRFGVFLGRGDGTFDNMLSYSMPYGSNPFAVATGDFSKDGKVDFAVANKATDSLSIYVQTC